LTLIGSPYKDRCRAADTLSG